MLSRKGLGDRVPALEVKPIGQEPRAGTLVAHEEGKGALLNLESGEVSPLVKGLMDLGQRVLLIDCFGTGEYLNVKGIAERGKNIRFFTTYNRTTMAERVQDILTGITCLGKATGLGRINIIGLRDAGLWCLLARGLVQEANSTVVDINGFSQDDLEEWLRRLFIPLIRRAGGLDTAIALGAPSRLFIHNCKDGFKPEFAARLYETLGASENLRIERNEAAETQMVEWITTIE